MKAVSLNRLNFTHILILQYVVIVVLCGVFYLKVQQLIKTPLSTERFDRGNFVETSLEQASVERISFQDVAEQILNNNLFQFSSDFVDDQLGVNKQPSFQPLSGFDFELVGIIEDTVSVEAIFENKKTRQVFYLKKNEVFDGYELIEVYDDKVVLEKANQRLELNKRGK